MSATVFARRILGPLHREIGSKLPARIPPLTAVGIAPTITPMPGGAESGAIIWEG